MENQDSSSAIVEQVLSDHQLEVDGVIYRELKTLNRVVTPGVAHAGLICRPNSHPFNDRTLTLDQSVKVI